MTLDLDREPQIVTPAGAPPLPGGRGRVELRGGRVALANVAARKLLGDEPGQVAPSDRPGERSRCLRRDTRLGQPCHGSLRPVAKKPVERLGGRPIIMADVAEKAVRHMTGVVGSLVAPRMEAGKADSLAEELAGGHYTHDDPITLTEARALGLPVEAGIPEEAYALMELFRQAGGRRPSVQYIPLPAPNERGPPRPRRPARR